MEFWSFELQGLVLGRGSRPLARWQESLLRGPDLEGGGLDIRCAGCWRPIEDRTLTEGLDPGCLGSFVRGAISHF